MMKWRGQDNGATVSRGFKNVSVHLLGMKSHFHLLILVIAFPVYSFRRTLLWFKKQQD